MKTTLTECIKSIITTSIAKYTKITKSRKTLQVFLSWLLLFTGLTSYSSLFSQRLKNANVFKTAKADDKLVDENLLEFPSNELVFYRHRLKEVAPTEKKDAYRILDFLRVPTNVDTSVKVRNGYSFTERAQQAESSSPNIEAFAVLIDLDGNGKEEVVRAMQNERGEILCYVHEEPSVGNIPTDLNFEESSQIIHQIPAPENFLSIHEGIPTIKLHKINLGESDKDHLLISYLRRLNDTEYQLNLELWQDGITADFQFIIPFANANNIANVAPLYDISIADFELDGVPEIAVLYQGIEDISDNSHAANPFFFARIEQQLRILKYDQPILEIVFDQPLNQTFISAIDVIKRQASNPARISQYSFIKQVPILLTKDLDGDLVPEILTLTAGIYNSKRENRLSSTALSFAVEQQTFLKGDIFQVWDDSLQAGVNFFEKIQHIGSLSEIGDLKGDIVNSQLGLIDQIYLDIHLAAYAEIADLDGDNELELAYGIAEYSVAPRTAFGNNNITILEFDRSNPESIKGVKTHDINHFNDIADPSPITRNPILVSDLDGDGISEIIAFRPLNNSNFYLDVMNYQKPSSNSPNGALISVGKHSISANIINNDYSIQILESDFDGDGIRIGKPRYFQRTGIQQPLAILNAPPIHFDQLNGEIFEINGCYIQEPNEDCEFSARYTNTSTTEFTSMTEFNSDWAIGASVEGSVSGFIAQVETKLETSYGQSFSKLQGNGTSITIGTTVEASIEDRIYASVMKYGIYEYPIYTEDSIIGHIMTITPELQQNRWFSTDSWSAFDYFPRHEVGNILSYEGFFDQNGRTDLSRDNTIAQQVQLLGDGLSIDNSSIYSQTLTFSDFNTNNTSFGSNLSVSAKASVSAGKKLFGVGAEVTASVSGDYSQSNLSTFKSTISNTLTLDVSMGSNQSGLESNYIVSPYLYWAKNGALVLDYTVQPEVEISGGTATFWSAKYGRKQDPSLLLPFRLHPEKGLTLQEEIKRFQSKGITYSPRNPQVGDTITLFAAIHNYSLIPTDSNVEIAVFLGNPKCGGKKRLTNTEGKQSIFTAGSIPARGRELVSFEWVIPEDITNNPRIFVVIDPEGDMEEIHENNNIGWTVLEVQGTGPTNYCNQINVIASVEQEISPTPQLNHKAYPNPFSSQSTIEFTLEKRVPVRLDVYDLSGRRIALLADETLSPGTYQCLFNGKNLPNGMYIYRLHAGNHQENGRLVLNR